MGTPPCHFLVCDARAVTPTSLPRVALSDFVTSGMGIRVMKMLRTPSGESPRLGILTHLLKNPPTPLPGG